MKEVFQGKKTFLVAGVVFLIAIGEYLKGSDFTLTSFLDLFQAQFLPLIIMTLRSAIRKIGK